MVLAFPLIIFGLEELGIKELEGHHLLAKNGSL